MVKTESREGSRPEATSVRESGDALMRAPRGSRLGIGLFGRRNVGKSSVLNAITNQQASIVSDYAGTTTDPVDKPMELLPWAPFSSSTLPASTTRERSAGCASSAPSRCTAAATWAFS